MVDRTPDATIDLHLFPPQQGGRSHDVETSSWKFRVAADGHFFDVMIETEGERLRLGSTNRVRSYFLDWPAASKYILKGAQLPLYELKKVGEVKVVEVASRAKVSA